MVITGKAAVYNVSSINANVNMTCGGYNSNVLGFVFLTYLRGQAELWVIVILYFLCFYLILSNFRRNLMLGISFYMSAVLIDSRKALKKYLDTYWPITLAVIYFGLMLGYNTAEEVHFLVPSLGASVNDYTQRAMGPCANYVSTTFGFFAQTIPQYCRVCNGISEPIAIHYLFTYSGSISSAFNQATVIGLALFKICSLLLSTYGFVDGETLMDVNEESCPWRNIHKCRSNFITTAQCNDYYYGEMEKFLDWIVTEESFGTALFILRAKGQVKRDTVKRPGVIEHIPKKYKEYLESKGEEVPERYSDVQSSWSYDDRKDMEMLTKFATDEDFVPQESMCEYASLVMEDLKLQWQDSRATADSASAAPAVQELKDHEEKTDDV